MPDAQLIEILIAAMVAGVILFRLYTVLGRRTGHEPQPQDRIAPVSPVANLRALPADRPSEPQARSLFDIQLADPSFETGHFLKGARSAYEIILKAFAGSDRPSLKPLLSDEVYKAFDGEIAKRNGAPAAETLAGITDAQIVHATLEDKTAEITVSFRAQFAHGAPSAGDYVQRDVTDVWTFARQIGAASPTWTLVATSGALP
ncbi:MAG TPA: Tim44/TimA family putative adaptor protein [Rhizomicrobium sp.]|jgi:predicted lipid-binding transport protein (Tim44 family)|nr:Tim44/TimA family putative adaptor protein [Rhizomicrobium sp.]